MPSGSTWLNRDKPRPFALATQAAEGSVATLLYGSTRETEKHRGAEWVQVRPLREGLNRNGLLKPTYFYPGTLLPVLHERLPPHTGFLGKSLGELRVALRAALGIGRGSCLNENAPAATHRGRIVALKPALTADVSASFGVVLTEPRYSAERKYQIILPIVTAFGRTAGRYDLLVSARAWFRVFSSPIDGVLLPIPIIQSIWHDDDVAQETEYVVDDETLREIDRRLCDYFSLAPVDAEGDDGR
jgi:hypothetical protein